MCSREDWDNLRVIIKYGYGHGMPSLRRRGRQLTRMTGLEPEDIDYYINSYMVYIGNH